LLKNSVMRSSLAAEGAGASAAWLASIVLIQIATEKVATAIRPAREAAMQRNAL
jgi:hypothetical protein